MTMKKCWLTSRLFSIPYTEWINWSTKEKCADVVKKHVIIYNIVIHNNVEVKLDFIQTVSIFWVLEFAALVFLQVKPNEWMKIFTSVLKSILSASFLFCWNSTIIFMLDHKPHMILRSFHPLIFKWQKQWDDLCWPNTEKSLLTIGHPPSWCYPLYLVEGLTSTSICCLISCWKGRKGVRLNLWKGFVWDKFLSLWSSILAWLAAFAPGWHMSLLGTGKV